MGDVCVVDGKNPLRTQFTKYLKPEKELAVVVNEH